MKQVRIYKNAFNSSPDECYQGYIDIQKDKIIVRTQAVLVSEIRNMQDGFIDIYVDKNESVCKIEVEDMYTPPGFLKAFYNHYGNVNWKLLGIVPKQQAFCGNVEFEGY